MSTDLSATTRDKVNGPALASSIRSHRNDVIRSALAQNGQRPSLLAVASLERLVNRVATAYEYSSPFILYDWLESFLRGHERGGAGRSFTTCMWSIHAMIRPALEREPALAADWTQMAVCVQEIVMRISQHDDHPDDEETLSRSDATLERLIDQLGKEDQATAEHSRAVSLWCNRISRQMNLSHAEAHAVTLGGLVHDIGKLRTPSEILNAPRALNDREWAIMRAHVSHGVSIVEKETDLRDLLPIVASHHERFDGGGYPSGLERYDICLGGRITAVADSFNAMIAQRPYKRPLSVREAVAELTLNQGTQFDPVVVAAMVEVVSGETRT